MPFSWSNLSLGEFVRLQRGHDLTEGERRPGTVPVLGSAGPNGYHDQAISDGRGVVIGRSGGSMGKVHFVDEPYWPHNTCLYVTDFLGNNPRFAYYLLKTLDLSAYNSGSAQPSLNRNYIYAMNLRVPPRHEQDAIAECIAAFDDRISLLGATSNTLHSIACLLFKYWFVDFEPARANASGASRDREALDVMTAALFPSELEESELGPIPKGWRVAEIGDLVRCVGGSTPSTKEPMYWDPADFAWATPKDLSDLSVPMLLGTERKISGMGLSKIGSGLLPPATLLMSSRAPVGYLALTTIPTAINQGFIAMPPGGVLPPEYLLYWASFNLDTVLRRANGSTFQEISKAAFRPIPIVVPPPELVAKFVETVRPFLDKIVLNESYKATLTQLRDQILPRLISGQLRIPDAEKALEEALH